MGTFSTLYDGARQLVAGLGGGQKPPAGEAGSDTEDWFTGYRAGGPDVNPELTGSAKFQVYDEMYKTDASIRSLVMFWSLPVRAASWGLNPAVDGQPAEDDPTALAVRDMVAWNLGLEGHEGELDLSWDETMQQGLQILRWGPMFEELVWGDVVEWKDADGDPHLVRPLARLAPRYPRTIQDVAFENGRVKRIEQWHPKATPIPGEKLSYLVFEREGGRWDGVAMIRPAWGPWRLKKALMIAAGIGWDRFALGFPKIWHPDTPEGKRVAEEIGRDVRTHERGYVRFPTRGGGTGPAKDDSDWYMEIENGAASLADPVPLLRQYSFEIARAGLTHFAELGNTETGSRATAQMQIDPFFLAVQTLANYMRRERQRQVIRKIVEVNFSAEIAERYMPQLTVSKIMVRNVETIAHAMEALKNAGIDLSDLPVQNDVRELLGFDALPKDAMPTIDLGRLREVIAGLGLTPEIVSQIEQSLGVKPSPVQQPPPQEGGGLPPAGVGG